MMNWNKQWSKMLVQKNITPTRLNVYRFFSQIPIPSDAKILDIGCGSGSLTKWWHDRGYDVLAVDNNETALDITSRKGISTKREDVEKLSFPSNVFDPVYSDGLLEHFEDCHQALSEIFRVSRNMVLTIVPTNGMYNRLVQIFTKPPKEYKKTEKEWVSLHWLHCSGLHTSHIRFGLLAIICWKDRKR